MYTLSCAHHHEHLVFALFVFFFLINMILITYKKNISLLTKTTLFEIFKKKRRK